MTVSTPEGTPSGKNDYDSVDPSGDPFGEG